jgi:ATP-dependent DNA ligase
MPRRPTGRQDGGPALEEYRRKRDFGRTGEWVEPELATLTHQRFSDPGWLYERKFDGERCLAIRRGGRVSLLTRNRKQVGGTYPELAEALAAQQAGDFLVDGEVVAFAGKATSFAKLQPRLGVRGPGPDLRRAVPVYWVEPKLVSQVAFTEWTGAGQLRHPRYLGLRRDKDPASVTREVARS